MPPKDTPGSIRTKRDQLKAWYQEEERKVMEPLRAEATARYEQLYADCKAAGGHFYDMIAYSREGGEMGPGGPPECMACGFMGWKGEDAADAHRQYLHQIMLRQDK